VHSRSPRLLERTVRRLDTPPSTDADSAAALIVQKEPPNYPEAARKDGIQGTVVLKVATAYSGDVKEVTVVSGDPVLARTAADTVMAHLRSEPGQGCEARGRRSRPLAPLQLGRSMLAPASQTLSEFVSNLLCRGSSLLNGVMAEIG